MGVEWSEERAFGVVNGILSGPNLGRRMSFERSVVDSEITLQSFGQNFPPKVSRRAMYAIGVETAWVMDWIAVFQL